MKLFWIALCAALFAPVLVALGQTSPGDMVVDVPFAFEVAGQHLPAGHYIVAAGAGSYVSIFNAQNRGLYATTHRASRTTSDGSKLVFHRYGDTYFLSSAWVTGNANGREFFRSKAEREMAGRKSEMEMAAVRPAK